MYNNRYVTELSISEVKEYYEILREKRKLTNEEIKDFGICRERLIEYAYKNIDKTESEAKAMENNNREITYINTEDELHQTVKGMISDDYKERFKAEYKQLIIRLDRLNKIINKMKEDKLDFKGFCSLDVLIAQSRHMDAYASLLSYRALVEDINLD